MSALFDRLERMRQKLDAVLAEPEYQGDCQNCGKPMFGDDCKHYVGPVSTDGVRRDEYVCKACFEVLP